MGFSEPGGRRGRLLPRLDALVAERLLGTRRHHGFDIWRLTDDGRARLEAARQTGAVGELPESPQHSLWRRARASAAERIESLRVSARAGTEEALGLLDARQRVRSDAWLLLAARLGEIYRRLGLASYCLYEWAEPDDARADIDDYGDPGDERLDADARGRLRSLRSYRRSYGNLRFDERDRQQASAGKLITVPPEMLGELRNGLHSVLGNASEGISQVTDMGGRERHPEWHAEHRERFERAWALLDLIGWRAPKQPGAISLDLPRHSQAIIETLDVLLLIGEDDLEEADAVDAERARHGEAPKRRATAARVEKVREFATAVKDLVTGPEGELQ